MRTDEQRMQLPTKKANSAEVEEYNFLCAALKDIELAAKDDGPLYKRLHMIPGGWRDIRMLYARFEGLLRDVWFTFEPIKRAQIRRTQDRLTHKLVMGPQVTRDEHQYVLCEYEFGILLFASTEYCKTCMGTPAECKQCQLGKVLDSTSFISRGEDRSWWEVMQNAMNSNIEVFE